MGTLMRTGRVEVIDRRDARAGVGGRRRRHPRRRVEPRVHAGRWLDGASGAVARAPASPAATALGRYQVGRVNEICRVDTARANCRGEPCRRRLYRDSTMWRIDVEPDGDGTRIVQTFEVVKLGPVMDRLFYLTCRPIATDSPALTDDIRRLGEVAAAG